MAIYQSIYNLIAQYCFGSVVVGSVEELVTMLVAVCATLFVVALPFMLVWKVVKML